MYCTTSILFWGFDECAYRSIIWVIFYSRPYCSTNSNHALRQGTWALPTVVSAWKVDGLNSVNLKFCWNGTLMGVRFQQRGDDKGILILHRRNGCSIMASQVPFWKHKWSLYDSFGLSKWHFRCCHFYGIAYRVIWPSFQLILQSEVKSGGVGFDSGTIRKSWLWRS